MKLPQQCAILVGGLGSRLGDLTAETPKPLLDCGDRPFLAWILRELSRFGIQEVILLAGHRFERIEEFVQVIAGYLPKPIDLKVSIEPAPSGTGGAVWHARSLLKDTFLLINGDSWLETNLARFFSAASRFEELGCILLRQVEDCSRYGKVELSEKRVVSFREKSSNREPGLISAGIYAFDKRVVEFLSPVCSLESDVLPLLADRKLLFGEVLDGYFIDIGIRADYSRARRELPMRLRRGAVFFDRDGVLNEDRGWVGTKERFHWIHGSRKILQLVNDSGFHAFVVTNQAGIARGYYTERDVQLLHGELAISLLESGMTIDDIRYCPYHPLGTVEPYRQASTDRKPFPGMILDLLRAWELDPHRCILVGDKESDLQAANAANIQGYLYTGGDLFEFVRPLLSQLEQPTPYGSLLEASAMP